MAVSKIENPSVTFVESFGWHGTGYKYNTAPMGICYIRTNDDTNDRPAAAAFFVMTFRQDENSAAQVAIKRDDGTTYARGCNSGTWSAWKTL